MKFFKSSHIIFTVALTLLLCLSLTACIEILLEFYPHIISALKTSDYYDEIMERQGIIENGTRLKEDLTSVLGRIGLYIYHISVHDEGVSIAITKRGL